MKIRLTISLILIALAFVLPWWVTLIFTVALSFYFKNFYEAVFVGLILDSVFGSGVIYQNFSYILTLVFFVSIFVINKIREKLIMY